MLVKIDAYEFHKTNCNPLRENGAGLFSINIIWTFMFADEKKKCSILNENSPYWVRNETFTVVFLKKKK